MNIVEVEEKKDLCILEILDEIEEKKSLGENLLILKFSDYSLLPPIAFLDVLKSLLTFGIHIRLIKKSEFLLIF